MKLYNEKAYLYDQFIKSTRKNYVSEAKKIIDIIDSKFKKKKISLLDLGCGTGNHAVEFVKQGYRVICADKNKKMLDIVKKKLTVPCQEIDMTNFLLSKKVDVVTCLFNTISYNKDKFELEKMFASCFNNLNENGMLIIDFTNPKSLKDIKDFSNIWDIDDGKIVQVGCMQFPKLTQFFILIDGQDVTIDKHITTCFSLELIKDLLNKVGFVDLKIVENKSNIVVFCNL